MPSAPPPTPPPALPVPAPGGRPAVLGVAAAALGVQAVAALGFGIREIVLTSGAGFAALGPAVYLLLVGVVLGLLARGVALGRRWSRGPSIAFQVLLLGLAWFLRAADPAWAAALLALLAVTVLVCLLSRPATRVFVGAEAERRAT